MTTRSVSLAVVLSFVAMTAHGQIRGGMSLQPGFADGLDRIAIVTEDCVPTIDCGRAENLVFAALRRIDPLPFTVEAPAVTRSRLMDAGLVQYDAGESAKLVELLGVDGFLVVRVLAAERESLPAGGSTSRVRVEVHFTRAADGRVAGSGGGGGQTMAPGTTIDQAVAETIERIFAPRTTGEKLRAEAKRKAGE